MSDRPRPGRARPSPHGWVHGVSDMAGPAFLSQKQQKGACLCEQAGSAVVAPQRRTRCKYVHVSSAAPVQGADGPSLWRDNGAVGFCAGCEKNLLFALNNGVSSGYRTQWFEGS